MFHKYYFSNLFIQLLKEQKHSTDYPQKLISKCQLVDYGRRCLDHDVRIFQLQNTFNKKRSKGRLNVYQALYYKCTILWKGLSEGETRFTNTPKIMFHSGHVLDNIVFALINTKAMSMILILSKLSCFCLTVILF